MPLDLSEYHDLKEQLDRIEIFQEQILSALGVTVKRPVPQPPTIGESKEDAQRHALQEQGRLIYRTQGMKAYKKFWQENARKTPARSMRRQACAGGSR